MSELFRIKFSVESNLNYEELQKEIYNIIGYMKNKKSIKDHFMLDIRQLTETI